MRAARADDTADVRRFLAFFDRLADVIVADKDSCPKMANDLNALFDANRDVLDAAKKAREGGKKLSPEARKHLEEDALRMASAMQKCVNDRGVQAALTRLQTR